MTRILRFIHIPQESILLLGARGTGKSTWLRDQLPDSIHLDMESPSLYRKLMSHPERLPRLIADAPGARSVVIDEIQHSPRLLPLLQRILKEHHTRRFILTTSCTRLFRRAGGASLGNMLAQRTLHPLLAGELRDFDLDHALRFGTLPGAVTASDPARALDAYRQHCVGEVTALGLTRHLGRFSRFLKAMSASHTLRLNIARMARACGTERKVVTAYIGILEDMLLAFRMPVYQGQPQADNTEAGGEPKRATVSRDKLFLFDTGFFRTLASRPEAASSADAELQALAGLVVQQVRAWAAYSPGNAQLYYWRTRAGTEIDTVVHGSTGTVALKVANSHRVGIRDLRALRAFRRDYPHAETAILYRGDECTMDDGTRCLPVADFLRALRPGEQLPLRPRPSVQ